MPNSLVPPATVPTQRDLKSPYFLLRTPDGLGSYFTEENLPIVASPKEPLARFLAPARLVESGTLRSLRYEISPEVLATAQPMEYLPQSEIDAFGAAVRAFQAKAHPDAPRVVQHEKRLRAQFRLPDPDLERDAYWVYGPADDRRLLVLWGAEWRQHTSLPLGPDSALAIAPGRTLLEKLQARVMSWEVRQREAMRFAFDAAEPISRFLARPAVNAAGEPVGVSLQGRTFEARALRPLRRVRTGECAAFERAARAFYDRASRSGVSLYEKEIRQAFRLSDPEAAPAGYFVAGKRLVIVVDGRESRDRSLPLTDHPLVPPVPVVPMAAAGTGEGSGPVVVADAVPSSPPTVAGRLRARSISPWVVNGAIAAAAVLALGAGLAWWRLAPDHTPPKVIESADFPAAPDNHEVVVKFTKPVRPESIQLGSAARPSFVFGDDAARIEGARVDPKDPSKVILATSPLADGKNYRLTVDNVTARSGTPMAEATSVAFRYLDNVAPELRTVSAGENTNQLVLVFSKSLAESSVARGGSYSLFALEAGGAGTAQRIGSGHLDPEDRTGRTVVLDAVRDFVGNQPYRLESIAGVTDASVSRNPVALPPKGLDFPYRDVLPPRIRGVSASASKLELTVTFSKSVDPASAGDLRNYAATGPDKSALSFLPGAAVDATGRNVTLRLAPSGLSVGAYRLTVQHVQDRLGNRAAAALSAPFEFADTDRSALKVASHSLVAADNQVDNKITLTFSRALNPAAAVKASNYTLLGRDRSPLDLAVTEARRVPDDPAQVILFLSRPPTPGVKVVVRVEGIADIFGQKPSSPLEYAFTPPGIPEPTEQVLDWIGQPQLSGNALTLTIKEAVARASALAPDDYVFSSPDVRVRAVSGFEVRTDPSGSRSTRLMLRVEAPAAARRGLSLRVRNLRADGLDFLGAQRLRPIAIAEP